MFTKNYPNYFDELYLPLETNGVHTPSSCQKLNVIHRKTNVEQKVLSYVGSTLEQFKQNVKHFNESNWFYS